MEKDKDVITPVKNEPVALFTSEQLNEGLKLAREYIGLKHKEIDAMAGGEKGRIIFGGFLVVVVAVILLVMILAKDKTDTAAAILSHLIAATAAFYAGKKAGG